MRCAELTGRCNNKTNPIVFSYRETACNLATLSTGSEHSSFQLCSAFLKWKNVTPKTKRADTNSVAFFGPPKQTVWAS